ncbi:hypothetical protein BCR43DRAFT_531793 [Syncephalastrum racemosum]|uniref:ubiquitinyl hydrolase 1 n=1 Tax=Syncephalastrum racemosum TaxID=13706 RepID=A0A1X2H814_SYNRA|nr:hypothetical protein BCR43DRAFT_531793 [Syncephalastrum racemosum]
MNDDNSTHSQGQQKQKPRWLPLEANPELVHQNGIDDTWGFSDIYEAAERFRLEEEAHLTKKEQDISPRVMFFKQTIGNACGMMALIHAFANNQALVGPGLFNDIIEKARGMTPDERADLLESNEQLASVHAASAQTGQTQAPDLNAKIDLHFICFTEVDHHLYELDGRKTFPINHGKCTDLVEDAAKVMRQFIANDPGHQNYSAIALTKL